VAGASRSAARSEEKNRAPSLPWAGARREGESQRGIEEDHVRTHGAASSDPWLSRTASQLFAVEAAAALVGAGAGAAGVAVGAAGAGGATGVTTRVAVTFP